MVLQWCTPTTSTGGNPPGETTVNVQFPDLIKDINPPNTIRASYDAANPGIWLPIQLDPIGLTESTVTFSSATFKRATDLAFSASSTAPPIAGQPPIPAAATNYQYILNSVERVLAINDNGILLSEGSNTAFNEDYAAFVAPSNGVIDQLILNFAVCLDVSAYVAGSPNLNSIDLTFKSFAGPGQPDTTSPNSAVRISPNSAFTALAATGTQILVVKQVINNFAFRVNQGQPLTLNITINETTGTATRNIGLLNSFPYLTTNQLKAFYTPTIIAHLKTAGDSLTKVAQYSNTTISGVSQ